MAQRALDLIGAQSGLTVTTLYTEQLDNWWEARKTAYRGLLRTLDRQLAQTGERAALIVDGDGTEGLYAQAHRRIQPARIPHSATAVPAHTSPWLQMADLAAYSACQTLARQPSKAFMWGWYGRHLPKAPAPERC
jgi:hypothetical protein